MTDARRIRRGTPRWRRARGETLSIDEPARQDHYFTASISSAGAWGFAKLRSTVRSPFCGDSLLQSVLLKYSPLVQTLESLSAKITSPSEVCVTIGRNWCHAYTRLVFEMTNYVSSCTLLTYLLISRIYVYLIFRVDSSAGADPWFQVGSVNCIFVIPSLSLLPLSIRYLPFPPFSVLLLIFPLFSSFTLLQRFLSNPTSLGVWGYRVSSLADITVSGTFWFENHCPIAKVCR